MLLVRRVIGDRDRRARDRRARARRCRTRGGRRGAGADRARATRRDRAPRLDDRPAGRRGAARAQRRERVDARGARDGRAERAERAHRDAPAAWHASRRRETTRSRRSRGSTTCPCSSDSFATRACRSSSRIDGERRELPVGIELSAYRIVQEALTNTLKHAGDARATVHVRYGPDSLELEIVDDGPGGSKRATGGGHGLVGMRERVALYGGRFDASRRPRAAASRSASFCRSHDAGSDRRRPGSRPRRTAEDPRERARDMRSSARPSTARTPSPLRGGFGPTSC